jgi:excinuclease ABC subunit B
VPQAIFVSATPGAAELAMCGAACEPLAELLIRPTGVVDPRVLVVPSARFEDHLLAQIARRQARSERALVTTLTKRSAEDLAAFLTAHGVRAVHLHADVAGAARLAAIEGLRAGEHDVLVGCNLLREGLDLPSVSLVAVVDADKMGFLRSATSLIQTIGRAARHVDGEAILYSHEGRCSRAMAEAIAETTRRRNAQLEHNAREGVSPRPLRAEGAAQQPADRERLLLLELLNGGKPAAAVRSDARPPPGGDLQGAALARYDAIRGWRDARARATRTRPFKILTEATMLALAEADPRSAAALRAVKGIGPVKAEQYGDALLDHFGSHATAAAAAERAAASLSEDPDAPIEEPAQPDAAKARVSPRPRRRTLAAAEVAGSVPAA